MHLVRPTADLDVGCAPSPLERLGPMCGPVATHELATELTVDHLDGRVRNNHAENLVPSCRNCNKARGDAGNPLQWGLRTAKVALDKMMSSESDRASSEGKLLVNQLLEPRESWLKRPG